MATVGKQLIHEGKALAGGKTVSTHWNHALTDAVYSIFAVPMDGENNPALEYKVQIQNVRCLSTGSYKQGTHEMEIYYDIHNWGTSTIDYRVWASWIQ